MGSRNLTDIMLDRLDKIDVKLDRIETQTTKTNGRVNNLENQSVKDKQRFDDLDSRLGVVERSSAVDSALSGRNSRLIDLVGKFGPWIVVVILFFLQLGLNANIIG